MTIETKNKSLTFTIMKVKAKGGGLVIEGYANRAKTTAGRVIIDLGNEYVPPEEWKLEEWLANPVVFFDHREHFKFPIGRGLSAKVAKDGLWVKVQISDSTDPAISRIRDLIREGILQTFSAGFDCQEDVQPDGLIVCRNCILREVSVVSIPMNQGSFFEITSKSYFSDTPLRQMRSDMMKMKGARVAKLVQEKIGEMEEANRYDHDAFMEEAAKQSKHTPEEIHAAMTGDQVSVADGILIAFSELLTIPAQELREANAEDTVSKEPVTEEKKVGDDDKPLEDEETKPEADDEPNEELADDEAKKEPAPVAAEPEEKPVAPPPKVEDEEKEPTKAHKKCFDETVLGEIPKLMDNGMGQDDAIQTCLRTWRQKMATDFGATVAVQPDGWQQIYAKVEEHKATKKKMVAGDVDQGQAATAAAQQTNVLLGQVIGHLQLIYKALEGLPKAQTELAATPPPPAVPEPVLELPLDPEDEPLEESSDYVEMAKCLDNVSKVKNNIVEKLKGHGLALSDS